MATELRISSLPNIGGNGIKVTIGLSDTVRQQFGLGILRDCGGLLVAADNLDGAAEQISLAASWLFDGGSPGLRG